MPRDGERKVVALDPRTGDILALVGGRDFKVRHRSQLWLERTKKGWKVIAFDIDQRPMRLTTGRQKPATEKEE